MNRFQLSYPVTAETKETLRRYPNIERELFLPDEDRSELEIVRLLDNVHYEHTAGLVRLINEKCGDSSADKLRVFVLDFTHSDTSRPDFFCGTAAAKTLRDLFALLTENHSPAYDVVLPALLGRNCYFGDDIWTGIPELPIWSDFVSAAGIDQRYQEAKTDIQQEVKDILEGYERTQPDI